MFLNSYLIAVVFPEGREETHILEELSKLKISGKALIFLYKKTPKIMKAVKKLKEVIDTEVIILKRKYTNALAFDVSVWHKLKEENLFDSVVVFRSSIISLPIDLFKSPQLPDLAIFRGMDGKVKDSFYCKSYILTMYEPDPDMPYEAFIRTTSQRMKVIPLSAIVFEDLNPEFPTWLYIEITTKCNLNCNYCIRDKRTGEFLSLDKFKEIINKFKKQKGTKVKGINLIGLGEPLLHKELKEMCKIIGDNGMSLTFTTNGLIYDEDLYKSLPPQTTLYVSIDGTRKNGIMKKTRNIDPDRVMETIRKIRKLRPNLNITLQPVLVKGFLEEALEFARFANSLNCAVHATVPVLSNKEKFKHLHPDDIEVESSNVILKTVCKKYSQNLFEKPQFRMCFDPFNLLLILINGDVFPCCFINTVRTQCTEYYKDSLIELDVPQYILGNIFKDSVDDIIHSDKLNEVRKTVAFTGMDDFNKRKTMELDNAVNYCKICLARWKKGC